MADGNSPLVQQQADFSLALAKLLIEATRLEMTVTIGEIERPGILARLYARLGVGIADSQHADRLAADLKVYVRGTYEKTSVAYAPLGKYWKALDPRARWGGDFRRRDGGHFEFIDPQRS